MEATGSPRTTIGTAKNLGWASPVGPAAITARRSSVSPSASPRIIPCASRVATSPPSGAAMSGAGTGSPAASTGVGSSSAIETDSPTPRVIGRRVRRMSSTSLPARSSGGISGAGSSATAGGGAGAEGGAGAPAPAPEAQPAARARTGSSSGQGRAFTANRASLRVVRAVSPVLRSVLPPLVPGLVRPGLAVEFVVLVQIMSRMRVGSTGPGATRGPGVRHGSLLPSFGEDPGEGPRGLHRSRPANTRFGGSKVKQARAPDPGRSRRSRTPRRRGRPRPGRPPGETPPPGPRNEPRLAPETGAPGGLPGCGSAQARTRLRLPIAM